MAEERGTLIIAPSWVGDMVMAQCLIMELKKRDQACPIDVLAPPSTAALARRMAEVRDVREVPLHHGGLQIALRRRVARQLRGCYDQAYVLPGSMKSALIPWLAGIARRTGYLGEHRYGLINDVRRWPREDRRQTARAFQALAACPLRGQAAPGPLRTPRLAVDEENQDRLLARWSLPRGAFVALAPGAEYGPAKQWPAAKYAEFARAALERGLLGPRTRIVIVGSARDRGIGEEIAAMISAAPGTPGATVTCGGTSLADAIDLLGAAGLVVTNDSGLMHVAAALARPVVAVYGSTLPDHTPPLSERAATVSLRLDCAPCFKRTCPLGHMDCLNRLEAGAVLEAATGLLTGRDNLSRAQG